MGLKGIAVAAGVVLLALLVFLALPLAANFSKPDVVSERPAAEVTTSSVLPAVRVAAMKGPTGIGLVKLMGDNEDGATGQSYDFFIGTIDEIIPKVSTGQLDIASVPANIASVLHNNTDGAVRAVAVNTLGVHYLVEKGDAIHSVADLKGRRVFASGKAATPEYILNYVLEKNGLSGDDLTVEYKSEPAEIIPLMAAEENAVAFLPQPFVATALTKVEGTRVALDWTAEWDKASGDGSMLVSSALVASEAFIRERPEAVELFLREFAMSSDYARQNTDDTARLCGKFALIDEAIAKLAIPQCNLAHITGEDMKTALGGYLAALAAIDPKAVGGVLPDEEAFYYN